MPSHKRWGKVTVTQMPRPDNEINEMTINDLIKSAVESIANDDIMLETPTTNEKGDV
jgi:hypothetical protein